MKISRGVRIKKHLGQHFLHSRHILGEIARAAELSATDTVLEVGPGRGELTELLASRVKKVVAVEKDRELLPYLREKLKNQKNIEIIEGDILKISGAKIKRETLSSKFKIVANIPYYITSRFLRKFLEDPKLRPHLMVLMVQYEVAKRITAKPPRMNLLALSVQMHTKPAFVKKVSRKHFHPHPKVDSAIIKLSSMQDSPVRGVDPKKLFEIARLAFRQKRKMLRHSLKDVPLADSFAKKRPEELSLSDWKQIMK